MDTSTPDPWHQNHDRTFLYCHDRHLSPRTAQAAEQVRNLSMAMTSRSLRLDGKHTRLFQGCPRLSRSRPVINLRKNHSYPLNLLVHVVARSIATMSHSSQELPKGVSPFFPFLPRSSSTTFARRSSASPVLQSWVWKNAAFFHH